MIEILVPWPALEEASQAKPLCDKRRGLRIMRKFAISMSWGTDTLQKKGLMKPPRRVGRGTRQPHFLHPESRNHLAIGKNAGGQEAPDWSLIVSLHELTTTLRF